ncbi:hypothetical protein Bbelb_077750 [Branchiostoma belcheri]|nr:hypothetical protein Bbelb_077750 [Branchiostoma belcheri]
MDPALMKPLNLEYQRVQTDKAASPTENKNKDGVRHVNTTDQWQRRESPDPGDEMHLFSLAVSPVLGNGETPRSNMEEETGSWPTLTPTESTPLRSGASIVASDNRVTTEDGTQAAEAPRNSRTLNAPPPLPDDVGRMSAVVFVSVGPPPRVYWKPPCRPGVTYLAGSCICLDTGTVWLISDRTDPKNVTRLKQQGDS